MLKALRTPTRDGETLMTPESAHLPALLHTARQRLEHMNFSLAGRPAIQVREEARAEVMRLLGTDLPGPWIMTGHQPEMIHAGVWFKDPVTAALAEAVGGSALHLVADLDTVKHTDLIIPQVHAGRVTPVRVSFMHATGRHSPAQLPPPTPEALEELIRQVQQILPEPGVFPEWAALARSALPTSRTLAQWLAAGRNGLDRSLGVTVHDVFASDIVRGRAFASFAGEIILRHREVHATYRQVLHDYRAAHHITNRAQPVPDLVEHDGTMEVPLWAFGPAGLREPLLVRQAGDSLELLTPSGHLATLPAQEGTIVQAIQDLQASGVILAPRALTLTMFLRTFLADVFVHGIGGAQYDDLGDEMTQHWLGWQPPPFVAATATLRLPLPRFNVTAEDLSHARWDRHHAWHNPHLYAHASPPDLAAQGEADMPPEVTGLLNHKSAALRAIQAAPRRSPQRLAAYAEIQRINADLRAALPTAAAVEERNVQSIQDQLAQNLQADGREFFFALMPRQKLQALLDQAPHWASPARPTPQPA